MFVGFKDNCNFFEDLRRFIPLFYPNLKNVCFIDWLTQFYYTYSDIFQTINF
ncbi:hypothetical protein J2W95_003394 [Flavobacterium granuli]|uniref:Uncharacterized protein n=1 Tax=Flavobacterium granuli TaxID=280093 RepID=A0ABU1S7K8_9FLAO|nr:hypothetical protein [Flavobacterium granuli]